MDAEILWTIPSCFRYNNNMKKVVKDILRRKIIVIIIVAFISSICIVGCKGEQEKVNPTEIRVAVIDTGISTKAIPEENISEGMNYVDTEFIYRGYLWAWDSGCFDYFIRSTECAACSVSQ